MSSITGFGMQEVVFPVGAVHSLWVVHMSD